MVRRMSPVIAIAALTLSQAMAGQSSPDTTQAHCAAAKTAAGAEHINLYNRFAEVCGDQPSPPAGAQPRRGGPPPQAAWHHDPVRVFDNLYFIGTNEHSSWAVQTSDGSSSSTRCSTTP